MENLNSPVPMKESLQQIKSTMNYQIEYMGLMAKLTRAKYLALIDEGFTPEQALELSKSLT